MSVKFLALVFFLALVNQIEAGWKKPWVEESGLKSIKMNFLKQSNGILNPREQYKDFGMNVALSVGTPPRQYQLSVRTNHQNMWLLDDDFSDCQIRFSYNPGNSSTSTTNNVTFIENYGRVRLVGTQYTDAIWATEDDYPRIASNFTQSFTNLEEIYSSSLNDFLYEFDSGVIGLAWNPLESNKTLTPDSPPILHILNGLEKRFYSIWHYRYMEPNSQNGGTSWVVSYGQQINETKCDKKIQYVPFNMQSNLTFQIDEFKFGAYSTKRVSTAWVDTEAFWVSLPDSQYNTIVKKLNAKYNETGDILTVDCDLKKTAPDMIFTLNGVDFAVKADQYVSEVWLGNNQCALLIKKIDKYDGPVDVVLGTPFIRSWCATFDVDQNQLGLSRSYQDTWK